VDDREVAGAPLEVDVDGATRQVGPVRLGAEHDHILPTTLPHDGAGRLTNRGPGTSHRRRGRPVVRGYEHGEKAIGLPCTDWLDLQGWLVPAHHGNGGPRALALCGV